MLRRRKAAGMDRINTEGWMMSYADMATILLAMFIVLSTLGKDQTGVNLYNGTGSFKRSIESFGLPGFFNTSSRSIQLSEPTPKFPGLQDQPGQENDPVKAEANKERIIDQEQHAMQVFLSEMSRHFDVSKLPRVAGQAVVDFFDRIKPASPHLTDKHLPNIRQVLPVLLKSEYRVFVVVWSTTPSSSAWIRAATQARAIADEIASSAGLDQEARRRLIPLGQGWRYKDYRRPIFSLIIARTESPDTGRK